MKFYSKQKNSGFTLIETMIAVFILTIALTSLLNLNASSIFTSRYAKNEIIANYLLQEPIDYIRNDRDTTVFQQGSANTTTAWTNNFETKYSNCIVNFSSSSGGCYFEPADGPSAVIQSCPVDNITGFGNLTCPRLNYDDSASHNDFYTYKTTDNSGKSLPSSNFKRQVLVQANGDEFDVKVTVEWLNGNLTRSRSLQTTLMKWQ
ncbi:MAG TPA: prepilin-type N-terminal cleavage/methylation domain-containing protein [Candidatus Paceibacterota bacterium]|jgi:prepilin-type N-terminal cleavage/methylation domain-containing protein|nr:prepilin-type N-terminal cleavage/methylation domain-containing protein [Candidatus Paceibacterota bacterium]